MAALSKLITVGSYYARVANRCKHVDDFILDEQALLDIAKMTILQNYATANSSLRKYYFTHESLPIVGGSAVKEGSITLAAKNYFDVTSVSYGRSVLYHPAQSITEFVGVQSPEAHQTLTEGRYWFWEQGADAILTFQGTAVVLANTEKNLNVWHVRYPDLSMLTLEEVRANTKFMDIPDWAIAFNYLATAIEAIKEQNLSVPQNLQNEMSSVLESISDKLTKEEMALQQAKLDTPTR